METISNVKSLFIGHAGPRVFERRKVMRRVAPNYIVVLRSAVLKQTELRFDERAAAVGAFGVAGIPLRFAVVPAMRRTRDNYIRTLSPS